MDEVSQFFSESFEIYPIPRFIDEAAARFAEYPCMSIPRDDSDPSKGWQDITFSAFSQAINRAAWWLIKNLGEKGEDFEALHFFVPQDLSGLIFTIASVKAGYKGIFCHPSTPVATHLTINLAMGCDTIIFSGEFSEKAKALFAVNSTMRIIAAPPTDYWLQESSIAPFPYSKTMAEAKNDPFSITHSSGSTGAPKAISYTQGTFMGMVSSLIRCKDVERLSHATLRGRRVAVLTPLTIAVGLFHTLGAPFSFGYTPVIPSAHIPMDIKHLAAIMKHADVSALVTSPKLLPEVLEDKEVAREFEKKIHSVIYAGSPLSRATGRVLTHMTQLSSAYGSTETGVYPIYSTPPEDWEYYQYDPIFHTALQPVNNLGYHEIVLPRIDDPCAAFQSCFDLYPNASEWRTKDLFIQHDNPLKRHLWRYAGRIDDLIIDQSGVSTAAPETEKQASFLTIDMEAAITEDARIQCAVICENRGGALAVVIEPVSTAPSMRANVDEFVNSIWPTLEKANEICPIRAQIKKGLVVVAETPLSKGAKGNVQRRPVQEKYAGAIDEAYNKMTALERHKDIMQAKSSQSISLGFYLAGQDGEAQSTGLMKDQTAYLTDKLSQRDQGTVH